MDQRTTPSTRLMPLPPEHSPELKEQFEAMRKNLGFIPNSILIMQRKPKLAKALAQMTAAVWDPESKVDRGFKRIIAHVASRTAGCQYCMAHTAGGALHFGVEDQKLAAIWEYQTSRLYNAAERRPPLCPTQLPMRCLPNCANTGRKSRSSRSLASSRYSVSSTDGTTRSPHRSKMSQSRWGRNI